MPASCFPLEALTQPRRSIAGTECSSEPAMSVMSTILAEDIVSMRHGAHEEEEIDRKMELAIPCGLRPDSDAVTVAIESPEEEKEDKKNTRTSTSNVKQDKIIRKQHRNNGTSRDTEVQHARTVKHETTTFPRPVLMLVAIFLKLYVADISG